MPCYDPLHEHPQLLPPPDLASMTTSYEKENERGGGKRATLVLGEVVNDCYGLQVCAHSTCLVCCREKR